MNLDSRPFLLAILTLWLTFATPSLFGQINFDQSQLNLNNQSTLAGITSMMYGPDGRLYVAEYPGTIKIMSIQRNSSSDYQVTAVETLDYITDIINHDDDGTPCSAAPNICSSRETIGITVTGTSTNPIFYVTSSDFRWGAGEGGGNGDIDLDTNSGIITRFSWNGSSWDVVDLVRGLPRSEENHATNGLEHAVINGKEYLIVASGGNTNGGSPSINFVFQCEYALSAAVLAIDLDALNAMPVLTDTNGRKYIYDLPTVDDPTRANANGIDDPNAAGYNGIDVNDPFGGNDGLNQAILEANGPVKIFSPGYRNAYDLVVTESGAVYATDNGANGGWGGIPAGEGGGSVTNNYIVGEPGSNPGSADEVVDNVDHLELITTDIQNYVFGSFYGGHPNPIRANPAGAGLYTEDSSGGIWRTKIYDPSGNAPNSTTIVSEALPYDWSSIVPISNPVEGDWRGPTVLNPDGPDDNPVATWGTNTNGIDEYTATNFSGSMQGDLIAGTNSGQLRRAQLNPNGTVSQLTSAFGSGIGGDALAITCNGDLDVFPGTIWAGTLNGKIVVFEPADLVECLDQSDPSFSSTADYDNDGYTNQDEIDNGSDYCNGASQPQDFDKDAGPPLVSDLNDLDDDNDGILDQDDPMQIGDPAAGGSDAFTLPFQNGLFNNQQGLGGYFGLGMTGLMNNGAPNPNWMEWLDDKDNPNDPNPNDVLGGATGLMTSHMTSGTANGTANSQEKGYQLGVQVDQNTGEFTVSGNLINFYSTLQLYGNTAAPNGELGLFIGDGTQSNFIKFVISQSGLSASQEINDVPQTPINLNLPINSRPSGQVIFYFVVDPNTGNVNLEYSFDSGNRIPFGTIQAQGSILSAIQQSNQDLMVGFIGTSGAVGVELEGTWDFVNVQTGGSSVNTFRINAGGNLVNATDGNTNWESNSVQGVHNGNGFSVNTGSVFAGNLLYNNRHSSIPPYIDQTTFNALFSQERWDAASGPEMNYTVPLANGDYVVNLYMGNSYSGTSQPGQRVFDISVEGNIVASNFDLITAFGDQSGGMLSIPVTLSDGILDITFLHKVENPLINAIEIRSSTPTEVPIVVNNINTLTSEEGETLDGNFRVIASGGNGALVYSAQNLPQGISLNSSTGFFEGTLSAGTAQSSPYNVIVTVDDSDGNSGDAMNVNFTWNVTTTSVFSLRINAAGSLVSATDGNSDWQANNVVGSHNGNGFSVTSGQIFSGNLQYANRHNSIPASIDEVTFNSLFAQERYDLPSNPPMIYSIPVSAGDYTVNLYMGNSYSGTSQPGQRMFDISIEDIVVASNFDLSATFGHLSGGMLSFVSTVADGELNISFGHVVENPLINAIEVISNVTTGTQIFVQPIADQNSVEGEVLNGSLGVVANGGDGDLSFVMTGQPPGVSIEPTNGQIQGAINAGAANNSPYNVTITVDDSDGESTDAVTINFNWNVTIPGSCNWTDLANAPIARFEPRAEIIDNKIYSIGGFIEGLLATDLNAYFQPETNNWSLAAPMPTVLTHSGSVVVGEEFWLIGGFVGDHPGPATDIVLIYNTKTDSWSNGPNLPQPIGSGAATYHNNKIHFLGGLLPDRQTDIGNHYVLDLSDQAAGWTLASPMPVPRNHHWAETLNGVIYSIGGQTGHDGPIVYLDAVHAYDPNTDSWTQVASLPRTRSHPEAGISVHDNKILVTGGRDGGFYFDDVVAYDPVSDNWTLLCNTPDPLLAPLGLAYNNQFILSGGQIGNTLVDSDQTRSLTLQPGTTFAPLQINPIADRTDNTEDVINFTVSGSGGDPFADLSFFIEGQPQGIDIDTRTGQISGTLDALANNGGPNNDGIYPVVVRMSKPGSVWVQFNFNWTVNGNTSGWFVKGEDPNYLGRHECGFVQAGDKFYLIGGRESSSVEMYDYQNDTWINLGNAPVNLNHFQGVEYQGLIWVIGALVDDNFPVDNPVEHIWIYSPVNNEWIQGPEIPVGRRRGAAGLALYNEKFYLVGGNTNGHDGGYVSWFDEYDPATGSWTTLPDAPRARDHFYASVIGDKLYAAAGRLSGGPGGVFQPNVPEVDVYDFTSGNWNTLPTVSNIPTPRAGPITVVYNGKLMLMGGSVQNQEVYGTETTGVLTLTEEFDPVFETWTLIEDANFQRRATQGIVSGNGVFTTGGSDLLGGGTIKNMEYYGQDNPSGTPLVISELNGPGVTQVPLGQNTEIALNVSNGNSGILIRSVQLTGPDATEFVINSGALSYGLLQQDSQHMISVSFTGTGNASTANLEINYGATSQLVIPLEGPVNNNLTWTDKNESENYTARHECSFVQAGDKFYLMGGRENSTTLDVYDYSTNSWNSLVNSSPQEFNHFQAVEYQGLIWVIGAFGDNNFPNEVPLTNIWIYDPANDEWIQGPEIPDNRRRGSTGLSVYNNKFYITGGNTIGHAGGYVAWFDEFDPATGTWTPLADAPRPRDHFHTAVIGDKLYASGGRLSGGTGGVWKPTIAEVDVYDFISNSWTTLPSSQNLPTPRGAAATVNFNDKLVVIGGEVDNELVYDVLTDDALKITEEYDPSTGNWTRLADMNYKRHGTQAIVSGNGIHILAGSPNKGGGSQKNMEYLGLDAPIGSLSTGSTLSAPASATVSSGTPQNINLSVSGGNVGIIVTSMSLSGPDAALFSINAGELTNSLIKTNTSHIVTIGYNGSATGELATLTVNYGVSDQITIDLQSDDVGTGAVSSFALINADTNSDLLTLTSGLQIDESTLSGANLAVRADTNPSVVGSVFLQISGAVNASRTENFAVYALFGNSGSDYFGQPFPVGSYTMTATAYSGSGLSGTDLGSLTIQFDIVNGSGGNVPPAVTNPGTQTSTEGDNVSLQIVASDESSSLNYSATGLPPSLSINNSTGLISGTVASGSNSGYFQEQNGLVVVDAESGSLVPTWTETTTGGASGIIAGSDHFFDQNGGTIPYEVTISTPGVYRFNWRSFYSGTDPTEENDNWLRFPNDNNVWFFGFQGTVTDEASVISNLQGAQTQIVFPKGSSRVTAGTTPNGSGGNGFFKIFRSGGPPEVYSWQAATSDNDGHKIYVWFVNPGTYTFEISERSLGHAIDRVALYKIDTYGDLYDTNNLTNASESPNGGGAAAGSPYSVEVTVTDDDTPALSTTAQFTWNIEQGTQNLPPMAIATANPLNGDAPLQVNFTGSSSMDDVGVVSHFWDFKDGNTSLQADPVHTFNVPGTYNVELTVQDGGGLNDTDIVTITVTDPVVNQPPTAIASATPLSGNIPLQVSFTGSNSTDDSGITIYSWNFGDGGSSNLADPVYTYNGAGNFTTTLTVTDAEGLQDNTTLNIIANDPNQNGVVSFTLVNSDTDQDIFDLSDGQQIDESTISGINLAIRANTNPAVVGSVFLQISGVVNSSRTENVAVYALFGNSGSDYFGQLFPIGSYTMTATAYSGYGLSGTNLGSKLINFSIGQQGAKQSVDLLGESVSLHPNPTIAYTNIIPDQPDIKIMSVRIFDATGRFIKQLDHSAIFDSNSMLLSTIGLEEGIYYLTIVTSSQKIFYKSLLVDKR